jgi:uncharacterized membrane protein YdjX (TVP38/TMEM64 family)
MKSAAQRHAAIERFWRRVGLRAILGYAALAVVIVAAVIWIGADVHRHLTAIEDWLKQIGPWGVVVYIAAFALLSSLFMPFTPLAMIGGALFGFGWGSAAASAGAFAGACLQYLIAKRLLRSRVVGWISKKPALLAIENAVQQRQIRMQTLVRLTPLSPALTSYLFGAAGVRFSAYCIGCLGEVPALLAAVYFGYAGRHYMDRAAAHPKGITTHDVVVGVGVILTVVVMLLVSRMAHKAVQAAIAQTNAAKSIPPESPSPNEPA